MQLLGSRLDTQYAYRRTLLAFGRSGLTSHILLLTSMIHKVCWQGCLLYSRTWNNRSVAAGVAIAKEQQYQWI